MNLSSLCINRPVLTIVLNVIIILFGGIGYYYLGVREFPSIDPPVITVRTNYAGANAEVIQSQITEPLEKSLNGIDGIRSISSASNQGTSNITIEFNLNSDLEKAANDVRDKVSQSIRNLPADIDGIPTVTKADANSDAILSMIIQSDTRSQLEVSAFVEDVLAERMQTITGVSTIQIWGQKKYAMRIWFDPNKLVAYRLTPSDIKKALDVENVELPTGKIAGDKVELTINTKGKLKTEEDFRNLIIRNDETKSIKLSDIGDAVLGPDNEETMLKESGTPMIGMGLVPQPGANYIDIADEFYKRLDQIKKDLPKDYKVNIALDNTRFIKQSILEVKETLLIALILVILIIYLFFRDWAIAIRPLIDIPVSLIGAFFIMYIFGFSINILTLLAIVLATGLVVDDGIVVTENIYKKIETGMPAKQAAIEGSREIFFAVISTSLTLSIVFLPVIFLEGFVGRLFREFGIVLASAVLISAFVSLTLTPMLNAYLSRSNISKSRFYVWSEPFFEKLIHSYGEVLQSFLKIRWISFIIVGIAGMLIYLLTKSLPNELAPLDDRSWFRIMVTAPEGASYEYTDKYLDKLANFANDSVPEKKVCLTVTAPNFAGTGAVNSGFVRVVLNSPDQRHRSQQQIVDYFNKQLRRFTEARAFVIQEQTISMGGGPRGALPVQFVIQAPNFEKLKEYLPKFLEKANQDSTFQNIDVNLKFNKPEINVTILRDRAKALGVSVQDIAQSMQLALSGQRISYFTMNGKQYQVIAQYARANRDEPVDIKSSYVKNNNGELIQLDNLIKTEEANSPPQLYHYNRYQSATVSAGLSSGKTIADGIQAMERIQKEVLTDQFSTALTGPSRDFKESSSNIWFALILALILIYLVLAAQFESFVDPLTIMFTVPLAIAGALISLWYCNQSLNIFSQIGIIMLIGLVTKNGILIVEFANQLKEKGLPTYQAIFEASKARFRPIIMTSLATALGALPIALALGAGAKSRMAMGIVVVGGVLLSLILTLFVIPAIYSFFSIKSKNEIR